MSPQILSLANMAAALLLAILPLAVEAAAPFDAPITLQEDERSYALFYEILGQKPKGFESFENFFMRHIIGNLSGAVLSADSEKVYEFTALRLRQHNLTFATAPIGGIAYRFEGRFLHTPPFTDMADKDIAVLEGTLTKLQNGREIATAKMRFKAVTGEGE